MTQTFEQWAESEGLDMSVDWKGELTSPVTAGALRGWEGAQSAGQEAVAWRSSYVDPLTCARVYYVAQTETRARDLVAGRPYIEIEPLGVIAAPVNGGERELGQVIDERDQYHDAAEKLADAIAKHFGVEIGEHSNLNCPWQNALDHIAQATKRAADAQQVGAARYEKVDGCKDCRHAHYYSADRWECLKANRMFDELGRPVAAPAWCPLPALTSPTKVGGQPVEGLGRMTAEGEGIVTLQFVSEDAAQAFMCNFSPSVDVDAMPDIPVRVGGDEREAYIASLPADWHKDSSLGTWFPLTEKELASTKRMFLAACADLGLVNEALGLDPDDGGAEPILDAIEELKARAALSAEGGKRK